MTKLLGVVFILIIYSDFSYPQNEFNPRLVGGPCEGCEAIFEYGDKELVPIDTLPDFNNAGPKMKLTGTIYQPDGKTPANNVILQIYHTDQNGIYPTKGDENGWGKRQGYSRGWIKTDTVGKYNFFTLKPGTYPTRNAPAHIHPVIFEPNGKYYWIEEYLFEDDPLLSNEDRSNTLPRGGSSGVLSLIKEDGLLVGERDNILGKNIPGYD